MKKVLILLIIIFTVSCKSDKKYDKKDAIVLNPLPVEEIQIAESDKGLIYNLDANTIVVHGDTIHFETPFIYSFEGLIDNKKIQIHLTNNLTSEYGEYVKSGTAYIEGEEEIFNFYFEKDKQNNYKVADVKEYYASENRDKTICKLKLHNLSQKNMYLDCIYNGKIYTINPSKVFPSYKCFDQIDCALYDCRKKFKETAMAEYVANQDYSFLAEIISNDPKYSNIESKLKYLTTDALYVKDYKNWKHQFHVEIPESEDQSYNTETLSNIEPIFIDEIVFVTSNFSYSYMGGAHGMMTTNYENYDVSSGKIIALQDILNSDTDEFTDLYDKIIKNNYSDSLLNENEVPMSNKFFILPTGIVFSYAPYELLGFAYGEPHIFISYEDLEPFVKKGSIIEKYSKK
jgi:hypothetical protein